MPIQVKKSAAALAASIMVAGGSNAIAATQTNTFQVTANIPAACTFATTTTGNLAFGTYDPFAGTALTASTQVEVRCVRGTAYQVGLNTGTYGAEATSTSRSMVGATNGEYLEYEIYSDAGRTTVWGNTPGTDTVDGTAANFSTISIDAYGSIPAGQDKATDNYSDTVTITVNY